MRKSILFGIFSSLLVGCGGGGVESNESPSPEPPAPEPPEEILYTNIFQFDYLTIIISVSKLMKTDKFSFLIL